MLEQDTASQGLLATAVDAWCSSPKGTQVLHKAGQQISQLDSTEQKLAQLSLQLTTLQQTIQAGVHELASIRQKCPVQAVTDDDLDTIEADTIQAGHTQESGAVASKQCLPAAPAASLGADEHMNDVNQPAKLGNREQQLLPKPEPALKTEAPSVETAASTPSTKSWDVLRKLRVDALCTRCWRTGHQRRMCWHEDRNQPHLGRCSHCGLPGHSVKNCIHIHRPSTGLLGLLRRTDMCDLCGASVHDTDHCFLLHPERAPQFHRAMYTRDHEVLCELGVIIKCETRYQPAPPAKLQRIRREIDSDSARQEQGQTHDAAKKMFNGRTRSNSRSKSRDGGSNCNKERRSDSRIGTLQRDPGACRASGQHGSDYPAVASRGRVRSHSRDSLKTISRGRVRSRSRDVLKAVSKARVRSRSRTT